MKTKTATRARESTTDTGTGTLDLDGAQSGYRKLGEAVKSGSRIYYLIENGTDWEVGVGTIILGEAYIASIEVTANLTANLRVWDEFNIEK